MGVEADRRIAEVHSDGPGGPAFWVALAIGWGVMAFGIIGALGAAKETHPRSLAIWIIGCLAVHDLIVAPAVFATGSLLRGLLPASMRAFVHASLIASAALAVVSIPVLAGVGVRRDNPTLLPRDYAMGLLVALGIVWLVTAIVVAIAVRRKRTPSA